MNKVKMLDMSFGKHEQWGHSCTLTENEIKAVRKDAFIKRFDTAFRRGISQDIDEDLAAALTKKYPHIKIIGENREVVDNYLDTLKELDKNQVVSILAKHNKQAKKMNVKVATLEGKREVLIVKIAKLRSQGVKLPDEITSESEEAGSGFAKATPGQGVEEQKLLNEAAENRMKLFSTRREELLAAGMDELDTVISRKDIIEMTDEEYSLYIQSVKNILKTKRTPVHQKTQADICDYIIVETFGKQTELGEADIKYHQEHILNAARSGIEIPEAVLADYPDVIIATEPQKSESEKAEKTEPEKKDEEITPGEAMHGEDQRPGDPKKTEDKKPEESTKIKLVDDTYTVAKLDKLIETSKFEIKPGLNKSDKIEAINAILSGKGDPAS